jgi:hypothetical protein
MNPAPDAELASVGEFYHNWIADAVTSLVFKRLKQARDVPRYRWDALLSPEPARISAVASQVEQRSRTIEPTVPTSSEPTNSSEARAASAVAETPNTASQSVSKDEPESRP